MRHVRNIQELLGCESEPVPPTKRPHGHFCNDGVWLQYQTGNHDVKFRLRASYRMVLPDIYIINGEEYERHSIPTSIVPFVDRWREIDRNSLKGSVKYVTWCHECARMAGCDDLRAFTSPNDVILHMIDELESLFENEHKMVVRGSFLRESGGESILTVVFDTTVGEMSLMEFFMRMDEAEYTSSGIFRKNFLRDGCCPITFEIHATDFQSLQDVLMDEIKQLSAGE